MRISMRAPQSGTHPTLGPRHRAPLTTRARRSRAIAGALTVCTLVIAPVGVGATMAVFEPITKTATAANYSLGEWVSGYFHGFYSDTINGVTRYMLCADVNAGEPIGVDPQNAYDGQAPGLNANQTAGVAALTADVLARWDAADAARLQEAYWVVQGTYTETVYPRTQEFANFINSYTASSGSSAGSIDATVSADHTNNYLGMLTIESITPSPATLTISMNNAIFEATGTNSIVGEFSSGAQIPIRGIPPVEGEDYEISGTIDLTAQTSSGYSGTVTVVEYGGGYQALIATPGANPTLVTAHAEFRDPAPRSTAFFPELSTQVPSQRITDGVFRDAVTFSLGDNGLGTTNEWPRSLAGSWYPVTADCTVYGPLAQYPTQSTTVPAGTPVAGITTITTTTATGPTAPYNYEVAVPEGSGIYTAVCAVDYADQIAATQAWLIEDYAFADDFGQIVETSTAAMELEISTSISAPALGFGEEYFDSVTAELVNGSEWLRDVDGNPVEVAADVTFYDVPADKVAEIVEQETAPDFATPVGSAVVTLTEDGVAVDTEGQNAPAEFGAIVAQACVRESDYVLPTCDLWGLPSETALISRPQIVTNAISSVLPGGEAFDRFEILGQLPAESTGIRVEATFLAYRAPIGTVSCTPENLVLDTNTSPVVVTDDTRTGRSDELARAKVVEGDILWVGQLWYVDEETEERELVDEGDCGEADEITKVRAALQSTGDSIETPLLIGTIAGGMLLVGAVILATTTMVRRRRND